MLVMRMLDVEQRTVAAQGVDCVWRVDRVRLSQASLPPQIGLALT